jgi:hypothetical protein
MATGMPCESSDPGDGPRLGALALPSQLPRSSGSVEFVDDLGQPIAYLVLPTDAPAYDSTGRLVGHVAQVLADEAADIFHGLIIRMPGIPDQHRFADPSQIAGLYERGVRLAVNENELHDPSEDPIADQATSGDSIREGLRRAWEWLSRPT